MVKFPQLGASLTHQPCIAPEYLISSPLSLALHRAPTWLMSKMGEKLCSMEIEYLACSICAVTWVRIWTAFVVECNIESLGARDLGP